MRPDVPPPWPAQASKPQSPPLPPPNPQQAQHLAPRAVSISPPAPYPRGGGGNRPQRHSARRGHNHGAKTRTPPPLPRVYSGTKRTQALPASLPPAPAPADSRQPGNFNSFSQFALAPAPPQATLRCAVFTQQRNEPKPYRYGRPPRRFPPTETGDLLGILLLRYFHVLKYNF